MCGYVIKEGSGCGALPFKPHDSSLYHNTAQSIFQEKELQGFSKWWGPSGGAVGGCCAMPCPHHPPLWPHSHPDGMRDLPPESEFCRWEEEMTMDLFPLGHAGVALDRMETNRREEVFLGLKSGIRMPTMEDMIAFLSFFRTLWMIKNDSWGNKTQSFCTSFV